MGTLQTWRKAYGALKDTTKVGLVRVNSDYADLDVAIVKATNHVECPPKDRHLRKIFAATAVTRARADVAYCIHALSRRLHKTRNWTVALKTLIVIHRLLREGDPTFREELLNFSQRGRILQLSNFKDDSSPIAWDCSAWVRTYALFLEERLECFRVLKYDTEAERLPKATPGQDKGYSRTRDLDGEELLVQLPALQQLLYRLIGCRPEGAANHNHVIQYALALVLKESFKVYCAINDGIINLIDKFFEMPKHEAMSSLEIYKRAGQQARSLSEFYEACKGLELARNFQFPVLREPPQSFLSTMEEYIKEAPRAVDAPAEPLLLTYRPDDGLPDEDPEPSHEEREVVLPSDDVVLVSEDTELSPPPPPPSASTQSQNIIDTDDLLGLNSGGPDASAIENQNARALAIIPTDDNPATPRFGHANDYDPSGWELALVTTPSNDISAATDRQLGGGLDTLTLNSLYDDGAYIASQRPVYGAPAPNPFEVHHDPFASSSNGIQTPQQPAVNNPFGAYQPTYHHQEQQQLQLALPNPTANNNPFGDFGEFPANPVSQQPNTSGIGDFAVNQPNNLTRFHSSQIRAAEQYSFFPCTVFDVTMENGVDLQQTPTDEHPPQLQDLPFSLPPYPRMIMEAIEASNGCNKTAIVKHIESTQITLPPSHLTLLNYHLNRMKQSGRIVIVKNNYTKPDPNAPPKCGRGRPPKPKPEGENKGTTGRPRGRPPKK
uniref:ENTH domain-containing protein n=1 Tax=Brassica campestris TaxID=3711 RepID=M4ECY7_BRACM